MKTVNIVETDTGSTTENMEPVSPPIRVMAVASGGGHWLELLRLRPALEGCDLHFVGIYSELDSTVAPYPFYLVSDSHFDEPLRMVRSFFRLLQLFRKIRPQVVVSTGAGCGALAMLIGRLFRARTIWIESAANCSVLSRSGKLAARVASTTLVQWPELARPDKIYYRGNILL